MDPIPDLIYIQVDIVSDDWLVGQLQLAGWLVGHLTKCYLCIDVKDGHSLMIWFRVRLTSVRWLVGWPIAAGWESCWLTGHLTKCWTDPPAGSDFGLGWHFVRWLVGWLAGWSSDKIPLVYWCKRWTSTRFDLGSGWHSVKWLVSWSIADDWLADWLTGHLTNCQPSFEWKAYVK